MEARALEEYHVQWFGLSRPRLPTRSIGVLLPRGTLWAVFSDVGMLTRSNAVVVSAQGCFFFDKP